jgi:uncharacterized LabA/DUF88 family protein
MGLHKLSEKEIVRTIIFVDHANVFHNLQRLKIRIDWEKFKDILARNKHLVGALIYMGTHKHIYKKKQRYFKYLKSVGFTVILLPILRTPEGITRQKGIDVRIFQDIAELGGEDAYDEAILVSGDADFCGVVSKLHDLGKSIVVWSFKKSMASRLRKAAGEKNVFYIDNIIYDIIKS